VALVSQNVHLFNDTVANNIAYARTEEYSREQIEEAARMAYAMDFINKMDNGLDTIIGENGVMLSGGQRQRIAIARALLRNSPILILMKPHRRWIPSLNAPFRRRWMSCRKTAPRWLLPTVCRPLSRLMKSWWWKMGGLSSAERTDLLEHKGVYAQLHKMQFGE
jgi:subfamily B ATP-binding cassette protein MsbA